MLASIDLKRSIVGWAIVVVALLHVPLAVFAATFERISIASDRTQANGFSGSTAISADGRFVAFESFATNLVPGDTNGSSDIFVRDRLTGLTTRESVGAGGAQANSSSYSPSISADGRFVAFYSYATNFFPGTSASFSNVYVRDRLLGTTVLVSASSTGTPGNNYSYTPSISANGRVVAFYSSASNLVPGDTNGRFDVFTRDLSSGSITRDSVASNGAQAAGDSSNPELTSDGRYVVFNSNADNLVAGDIGRTDVFVHDRSTGQTTLESVATNGAQLNGDQATISADGRFVAFIRPFNELTLRDRQTGQTASLPNVSVSTPKLSPDGRYLVFSRSGTLAFYDRMTGQFTDVAPDGFGPSVATNALAFATSAALVSDDTNNSTTDVYVFGESLVSGAPGPPAGLTASASSSNVTLAWSVPLTGGSVTGYLIEAGSSPGAADLANFPTGSNATTFFASGVGAGTYYVRVRASNSAGTSAPSNEAVLIVGSNCAAPGAPSNLSAAISGSTVTLTWVPGTGATSYLLLVGSGPGRTDLLVSDLRSAAVTLVATNVAAGTYFVRLQSLNACGQSGESNEVLVIVR